MSKTKVTLLGAGFISDIHAESYRQYVADAELVGVYARNVSKAKSFAERHHIPQVYDDLTNAVNDSGCDVVDICLPNFLHHQAVLAAAEAGKHVIVEKPLAMNLREADEMIDACRGRDRKLMYAEELCFAPKYERVRQLVAEKSVGKVFQMRQCERHDGPHSDWFYDIDKSGGGVLLDMGCHAIAWFRWMLGGRPKVTSVYGQMQNNLIHGSRTRAEENSIVVVEFEEDVICVAENSWAKPGGMDDRVEVYGTGGVVFADLFMGNAALAYSEHGYEYAMEKANSTKGWTFAVFEEAFNQGYPQELRHFIECVREDQEPSVTGEDGRAVLEIMLAAYQSARSGEKVRFPFTSNAKKPIDLWLGS